MKRYLPYLILLVAALALAVAWMPPRQAKSGIDVTAFSRLPVLAGGRIKPLDTVARNSLLILRGKQTVRLAGAKPMDPPIEASRWLADVLFNAPVADSYPVFVVANQDVLALCGLPQEDKRYCTFAELKPTLEKIDEDGRRAADVEAAKRTPYHNAIFNLRNSLILYQQLKNSVQPEESTGFTAEVNTFATAVAKGVTAVKEDAQSFDKDALAMLQSAATRYQNQAREASMLVIAPPAGGKAEDWLATGDALLRMGAPVEIPVSVTAYATMGDAFRAGDGRAFAQAADKYLAWLRDGHPDWLGKTGAEVRFNRMEPFFQGMVFYVAAFLLVIGSWLVLPKELRKAALLVLLLAFAVHTYGMVARMWLQGRPPVTNMYSSAILVGWGAVVMAMVLEGFFRYGIALACACVVGFVTLIIAHHLATNGDTLEMMTAVLDNNIWLATHVVVITLGYSAMFLAGGLAVLQVLLDLVTSDLRCGTLAKRAGLVIAPIAVILLGTLIADKVGPASSRAACEQFSSVMLYVFYGVAAAVAGTYGMVVLLDWNGLRRRLVTVIGSMLGMDPGISPTKELGRVFSRMVYGIVCFATLFSFVGTVLGGIWGDQSWGRFWGWDPKENGALLIVLWCALILHARWGGMIRQRGLMAMAIFGNAVTSFSWFGVNMLNIGLHSYGFMDQALPWLAAFISCQVALVAISLQKSPRPAPPAPLPLPEHA